MVGGTGAFWEEEVDLLVKVSSSFMPRLFDVHLTFRDSVEESNGLCALRRVYEARDIFQI